MAFVLEWLLSGTNGFAYRILKKFVGKLFYFSDLKYKEKE